MAEWIRSNGRFDLNDVADRAGVLPELEFLKKEYCELLYDDLNNAELEVFFDAQQEKAAVKKGSWFRELLDRWF
jgi:hypothetical protein